MSAPANRLCPVMLSRSHGGPCRAGSRTAVAGRVWDHAAARVIGRFERSGPLERPGLDEFAESFLADEIVFEVPADLLEVSFR
jgi:hypothetical protein